MKVLTGSSMKDIVEKNHAEILKYMRIDYMIPAVPVENYYAQKRPEILKLFYEENARVKFDRKSMEHRYTGMDAHTYHGFPKHLGLPIERFGKMKFYLMWMSSGISPVELDKLLDRQAEALGKGIENPANAAMIGLCIEEMRGRKRLTIHTELLYNFMAVQWVRDDEDPLVFNNQIQLEKVEAFKRETAAGNTYFFFQQSELKMLSNLFRMSEEEWKEFWNESLNNQAYLKAMSMMKYSSKSDSIDTSTTSKPL